MDINESNPTTATSGQQGHIFKTYTQVLRDKTIEYLQSINLASPPSPDGRSA